VKRRLLGRTELAVSEVGFGAWAIGGNQYGNSYGPTDDAESVRAVRRAFDLGCNFFDTADVYGHGHSEEILGAALAGLRDRVFIATKVGGNFYNRDIHPLLRDRVAQAAGVPYTQLPPDVPLPVTHDANFSSDYVRFALGRSLERLRTDYVDLLQLHNPPLQQIGAMETYGALEDLRKEGLIRAYGVSVHSPEEGLAVIQSTMPDTVQLVYNLARREPESAFFPAARSANIGVIVREPLANGFLAGRYGEGSTWDPGDIRARMPQQYVGQLMALGRRVRELATRTGTTTPAQLALKFVLDNPTVSTVIVGTKTVAQADENFDVET
jgi:aryl-alcohol dehydrogenase-like predicted oxidoreductase